MLKNAYTLAIVGLDTAENGLSKVRQVTSRIDAIIGFLPVFGALALREPSLHLLLHLLRSLPGPELSTPYTAPRLRIRPEGQVRGDAHGSVLCVHGAAMFPEGEFFIIFGNSLGPFSS